MSDIKRTLDAMSWVKVGAVRSGNNCDVAHRNLQLNQFHWHVVDSQSFPLQVPGYTELAAKGAYSASQVYSPNDVADIVSYAGAVSDVYAHEGVAKADVRL